MKPISLLLPLLLLLSFFPPAQAADSERVTINLLMHEYPFKSSHHTSQAKFGISFFEGLGLGFVGMSNSASQPRFKFINSYEVFVPSLVRFTYRPSEYSPEFSFGFMGFSYKNLLTRDGTYFTRGGNIGGDKVEVNHFPEGSYKWSARIQYVSFMFPLTIRYKLSRKASLAVSGILNITNKTRLINKYRIEGRKVEDSWNSDAARPIGFDIMLRMRYSCTGWYIKYTPTRMFRPGCGPEISTITTGLALGF